jgi:hypothetical protein
MKTKFKVLVFAALTLAMIIGGTVPALAGTDSAPKALTSLGSEVNNETDAQTAVAPGNSQKISGIFRGVWGCENDTSAEPCGKLRGTYRTITKPDGTVFGFFRGQWQSNNGKYHGWLKGKFEDGSFRGIWRCKETNKGGTLEGRYYPSGDPATEARRHFVGKWTTRDGQKSGYLKGTWHPLIPVEVEAEPLPELQTAYIR